MSPHVNGEICPLPSASPPPSPKGEGKGNFGLYKDCYVIPSSVGFAATFAAFKFYDVILTLSKGEGFFCCLYTLSSFVDRERSLSVEWLIF